MWTGEAQSSLALTGNSVAMGKSANVNIQPSQGDCYVSIMVAFHSIDVNTVKKR